ncbi:MAG: sulfide-dependent adenosine diphosphate thiazole synthase [Candidatus Bathyarchaeia archaeon]
MDARELRKVEEDLITRIVLQKSLEDLIGLANTDVIVVGAGPSGLTAARYLGKGGLKVVVLERRLSFGGGIGGGGMLFHKIVVQSPAEEVLRDFGCRLEEVGEGFFVVDAAEMMAKLATGAIDAGAKIMLGITVDDLVFRSPPPEIKGVVVQWTSVVMAGLHVDPLALRSKAVIDCTGHDAEVLSVASKKIPELQLGIPGEKAMWASMGEECVVEKTGEVCPGLFVAGMAVAALHGTPRMGPIFGGMLLSGRKVANLLIEKLKGCVG